VYLPFLAASFWMSFNCFWAAHRWAEMVLVGESFSWGSVDWASNFGECLGVLPSCLFATELECPVVVNEVCLVEF